MLKLWSCVALAFLLAAALVHAQTDSVVPSDDGKEPKTLTRVASADPAATKTPPSALAPETSFQPETNYRAPFFFGTLPTTDTLAVRTAPLSKNVDGVRVHGSLSVQIYKQPKAAILLLPEWWGLTEQVKSEAAWYARNGYKVLGFDLYDGKVVRNRGEASRLMSQLKPEEVLPRLKAAVTLLAQPADKKSSETLKVGIIGYGVGATWAQRLAAEDPRPEALVIFYGDLLKDPALIAKIRVPVLGIFASRDAWVTPEKIEAFKKALTGARLPLESLTLQTTPGFMFNNTDPTAKNYAETAHQRVLEFLGRELTNE